MNNQLMILKTEKEQAEMSLRQQINTLRTILNNTEKRLDNGEVIYGSEGFQGNGVQFDVTISKIGAYTRAIEQFEKYVEKQEKKE